MKLRWGVKWYRGRCGWSRVAGRSTARSPRPRAARNAVRTRGSYPRRRAGAGRGIIGRRRLRVQRTPAIAVLVCIAPFASGPAWALDPRKAMYVGGTVSSLPPGNVEGSLDFSAAAAMFFVAAKGGGTVAVQWKTIQNLEYGPQIPLQWKKKSRSLPALPLLSKKGRKHYVTI